MQCNFNCKAGPDSALLAAGQAVVQFAEDYMASDRCQYALKFFLDRDAFDTEAALYAATTLQGVLHSNHACALSACPGICIRVGTELQVDSKI